MTNIEELRHAIRGQRSDRSGRQKQIRDVFLCPFSLMRTGFVSAPLKRLHGHGMALVLISTARLQIKD